MLVETGSQSSVPALLAALDDLGIGADDLAHVVVTHIHLDHAGGVGDVARAFPKATVHVHEKGARHLVDPAKLVDSAAMVYGDLLDSLYGRLTPTEAARVHVLEDGEELGSSARPGPDHRRLARATPSTTWPCTTRSAACSSSATPSASACPTPASCARPRRRRTSTSTRPSAPSPSSPPGGPTGIALAHYGLVPEAEAVLDEATEILTRWAEVAEAAWREGRDIAAALDEAFGGDLGDVDPRAPGEARDAQRHPLQRRRLPALARQAGRARPRPRAPHATSDAPALMRLGAGSATRSTATTRRAGRRRRRRRATRRRGRWPTLATTRWPWTRSPSSSPSPTCASPLRLFRNGYQSWSLTDAAAFGLDEDPSRGRHPARSCGTCTTPTARPPRAATCAPSRSRSCGTTTGGPTLVGFIGGRHHDGTLRLRSGRRRGRGPGRGDARRRRAAPGHPPPRCTRWSCGRATTRPRCSPGGRPRSALPSRPGPARPYQVGWCSWYHYFDEVTEVDIDRQPRPGRRLAVRRVPAGRRLPVGHRRLAGDQRQVPVRASTAWPPPSPPPGYTPGIWLAPFIAVARLRGGGRAPRVAGPGGRRPDPADDRHVQRHLGRLPERPRRHPPRGARPPRGDGPAAWSRPATAT